MALCTLRAAVTALALLPVGAVLIPLHPRHLGGAYQGNRYFTEFLKCAGQVLSRITQGLEMDRPQGT